MTALLKLLIVAASMGTVPQHGMTHDVVCLTEFNWYGTDARYQQIIFWRHGTVLDYRAWPDDLIPANPLIWKDERDGIWRHVDAMAAIETITPDRDKEMEDRERVPAGLRRKLSKPRGGE